MLRAGSAFGPKLAIVIHPVDPATASPRAGSAAGGPRHAGPPGVHARGMGLPGPHAHDEVERTMAHPAGTGTSARAQRLTSLVAITLVATAVGFAFGRVFLGQGATYRILLVGIVSGVVAWAFERRNLLLATLASAGLLIVVLAVAVFPSTTWFGAPTLETLPADRARRRARRRASPDPGLARVRARHLADARRDHGRLGRGLLLLRAGVPRREPAALPRPADRAHRVRRQRPGRLPQADVRRGVPARRALGPVRGFAASDPELGTGVELAGRAEPPAALRRPHRAADRRGRARPRGALPADRAGLRLEGGLRPVVDQQLDRSSAISPARADRCPAERAARRSRSSRSRPPRARTGAWPRSSTSTRRRRRSKRSPNRGAGQGQRHAPGRRHGRDTGASSTSPSRPAWRTSRTWSRRRGRRRSRSTPPGSRTRRPSPSRRRSTTARSTR